MSAKEYYCKKVKSLDISELGITDSELKTFVEEITPQELLANLRYYSTIYEAPKDICDEFIWSYDSEYETKDGEIIDLYEKRKELINIFDKLSALGYIRDYNELYYTKRIVSVLSSIDFEEYLLMEGCPISPRFRTIARNERYETLRRVTQSDLDKILLFLRHELPPLQYSMIEYAICSNHYDEVELHEGEREILNLARRNIRDVLSNYIEKLMYQLNVSL